MEISLPKKSKQVLFAAVVALLACTVTYIFFMWDIGSNDKAVLVMAAVGYLFWPLYRLSVTNRKQWTNVILGALFFIVMFVGVFSALAMYDGLHRTPPKTDAGDGIIMVWGFGFLGFVASSVTVLLSGAISAIQKMAQVARRHRTSR